MAVQLEMIMQFAALATLLAGIIPWLGSNSRQFGTGSGKHCCSSRCSCSTRHPRPTVPFRKRSDPGPLPDDGEPPWCMIHDYIIALLLDLAVLFGRRAGCPSDAIHFSFSAGQETSDEECGPVGTC